MAPLDLEEAKRVYPIVSALESLAVRMLVSVGEELADGLTAANERLRAMLATGDGLEASRADDAFHSLLVDAAQNHELSETIDRFKARLQRFEIAFFRGPDASNYSVDEHAAIIESLRHGDLDGAARAVDANWKRGLDRWATPRPVERSVRTSSS
ncbi:MAG: GntR family transcriptional regulator [Actinomycetota bacterium]